MSSLRLILTRHAKSSWDDPLISDHDRPLNKRGARAADLIGDWLASRGDLPEAVLCSDAKRTQETWARMAPKIGGQAKLVLKSSLYHAGPDVMLAVLRGAEPAVVMMLGHNPGIAEFAERLLSRAPANPEFARFPSGATLVATFEAERWADVGYGTGAVMDFITPRALES